MGKQSLYRAWKWVLIDTWWNVNVRMEVAKQGYGLVLIDTWWNVNVICRNKASQNLNRFNRYMVECEFSSLPHTGRHLIVLIDTWWNVNARAAAASATKSKCFNRYMVECESLHSYKSAINL